MASAITLSDAARSVLDLLDATSLAQIRSTTGNSRQHVDAIGADSLARHLRERGATPAVVPRGQRAAVAQIALHVHLGLARRHDGRAARARLAG